MEVGIISQQEIEQCHFNGSICSSFCDAPHMFVVVDNAGTVVRNGDRDGTKHLTFQDLSNSEKLQDFCTCSQLGQAIGLNCADPDNVENCTRLCERDPHNR